MKIRVIIIAALISVVFVQGKKPRDYSKILPGVVKVTDYLYYDVGEISNLNWLEYLNYQNKQGGGHSSAVYQQSLPDTNVWVNSLSYNEPYVRYYLRHAAYHDYPVVGVSWKQASDYCAWRTKRVKEVLEEKGDLDKAPAYFTYRLPTQTEWQLMYADVGQLTDQIGEEGKKAYRGMFRWNMKRGNEALQPEGGKINDNGDVTAPVKSYWPNQYGVYNIKGNVSEWLLEENTYIGGAWNVLMSEDVSVPQKLESASAAVGFRCVCEVAEDGA